METNPELITRNHSILSIQFTVSHTYIVPDRNTRHYARICRSNCPYVIESRAYVELVDSSTAAFYITSIV